MNQRVSGASLGLQSRLPPLAIPFRVLHVPPSQPRCASPRRFLSIPDTHLSRMATLRPVATLRYASIGACGSIPVCPAPSTPPARPPHGMDGWPTHDFMPPISERGHYLPFGGFLDTHRAMLPSSLTIPAAFRLDHCIKKKNLLKVGSIHILLSHWSNAALARSLAWPMISPCTLSSRKM